MAQGLHSQSGMRNVLFSQYRITPCTVRAVALNAHILHLDGRGDAGAIREACKDEIAAIAERTEIEPGDKGLLLAHLTDAVAQAYKAYKG